jgi:uncharacterized protein involved in outer membrane biogenesis
VKRRSLWLIVLLLLAALPIAAYFLLDTWLESAGGRSAIEQELARRSGMPVSLQGDFSIGLLPTPGVSGTRFVVGDPLLGRPILSSGAYRIVLDLSALVEKRLEILELELNDIRVAPEGADFRIRSLALRGYAENQPTQVSADLAELGVLDGVFTWFPARSALRLASAWQGPERQQGSLALELVWSGAWLGLRDIDAELEEQAVRGSGCVSLTEPVSVNLDLESGGIDLERVLGALPQGQGDASGLPFILNLRLKSDRIVKGETSAQGVVLELGAAPSCPG